MRRFGRPIKRPGCNTYSSRVYDDTTRKANWRSTGVRSLEAARAVIRQWEHDEVLGPERAAEERALRVGVAFHDAYEAWIASKQATTSPKNVATLRGHGKFWLAAFGDMPLAEIDRAVFERYRTKRRAGTLIPEALIASDRKPRKPRAVSITTMNNDRRRLSNFFEYCIDEEWVSRNPIARTKPISGEPTRHGVALSEDEERRLVACCRSGVSKQVHRNGRAHSQSWPSPDYLAPLVVVALRTGLRRRTLQSLRWKDVDLEAGMLTVPGEFVKTGHDLRRPLSRDVGEGLSAYRASLAGGENATRRLASGARIFGLDPESDSAYRPFKNAARRAGLPDLTFHDLRRVFLNALRSAGVDLDVATFLTGHADLRTVEKHYRLVGDDEARAAIDALDQARA
ncbi:MAG: tyrosine-type recombinase/integrase [Planctomycetota bacterium]